MDILKQLAGMDLGDALLLPDVMLRHEGDLFLDDVSLSDLSAQLNVPVITVGETGTDLLEKLFGTANF